MPDSATRIFAAVEMLVAMSPIWRQAGLTTYGTIEYNIVLYGIVWYSVV